MKTATLILLFSFMSGMFSYVSAQVNEETIIRGELINIENIEKVYLKYSNKTDTVSLDNNFFEASMDINKPIYLYFTIGLGSYPVYIFPGDTVNIELEKVKKLDHKITFKTNNPVYSEYFNFVNNTSTLLTSDTNYINRGDKSLIQKVDTIYKINTDYFNKIISSNSNLDDNFIKLEPLRLYFSNKSLSVSLSGLSIHHPENVNKTYNDSVFRSVSKEINLDDSTLMQIEDYKILLTANYTFVMSSLINSNVNDKNGDVENAKVFDLSMLGTFKTIDADFTSPAITDYLKYYFIGLYLPFLDKLILDSSYNYFLQTCKNKEYIDNLKAMVKTKKENLTGIKAPEFSGNDISGKKYSLTDFKGKFIFIDFWATWCGPCREETPNMKALHKYYEDNEDIVIISFSIDKDIDKWKKVVMDENMNWLQLHTPPNSKFLDEYQVEYIPKFVLIDKEGILLNPEAPRPSSKELIKLLDKYLKK